LINTCSLRNIFVTTLPKHCYSNQYLIYNCYVVVVVIVVVMSWAYWDLIERQCLLVLVCTWTVQVWDITDLNALKQLATMNYNDHLVCVQVVYHDSLDMLLPSLLLVYSLSTHILLHQIHFFGVASAF